LRLPEPAFSRANRVILDTFSENLRSTFELARRRDVPVVVVTVVSNLHEFPVRKAQWPALLSGDWTAGKDEYWRKRLSAQLGVEPGPDLEASEGLAPWWAHYLRGIQFFQVADYEAALAEFKQARDSHLFGRAPSIANERLRELSAEDPNVHLVDFELELDGLGVETGIGCDFFGTEAYCDNLHPNPRTNELIANAVARKVLDLRGASDSPAP
jgi:hypothetical protein